MLGRSPKVVCVKSELLTPSIKQAMDQKHSNLKISGIHTKTKWQIIRVVVSNSFKFDLRWDPKWMCC